MNTVTKTLLSIVLVPVLLAGNISTKSSSLTKIANSFIVFESNSEHQYSAFLPDRAYPAESSLCPHNHSAPSGFVYQGCSAGTTSSLPNPVYDTLRIVSIAISILAPNYITIPLSVIVELLGQNISQGPTIHTFTYIYNGYPVMYYHEIYTLYVNGTYHYLTCQTEQIISQFVPE